MSECQENKMCLHMFMLNRIKHATSSSSLTPHPLCPAYVSPFLQPCARLLKNFKSSNLSNLNKVFPPLLPRHCALKQFQKADLLLFLVAIQSGVALGWQNPPPIGRGGRGVCGKCVGGASDFYLAAPRGSCHFCVVCKPRPVFLCRAVCSRRTARPS